MIQFLFARLLCAVGLVYVSSSVSLGTKKTYATTKTTGRSLIINGKTAQKGRYPYFVSLMHHGGGVLIAPDIVLTAGHCQPMFKKAVRPRVGTYSFHHDVKDVDYEQFDIVEMVLHPGFVYVGEDEFIRDFSLLKLSGNSSHTPIRINRDKNRPVPQKESVIAMGVGNTNPFHASKADTLQEVSLDVATNEGCAGAYDPERNETYAGRIFPSMMCTTGGYHNSRDACDYDSGSPIILAGDSPEEDILVALVSWGMLCADPFFPGVNARVSQVSEWIDATVCLLSDNPPADFCAPSPSSASAATPIVPINPDTNTSSNASTNSEGQPTGSRYSISAFLVIIIMALMLLWCIAFIYQFATLNKRKGHGYRAIECQGKVGAALHHHQEGKVVMDL